jgi:hypothetical protein
MKRTNQKTKMKRTIDKVQVETRSKKKMKKTVENLPFLVLDDDSITVALTFLNLSDVLSCSRLCQRLKKLTDSNQYLWKSIALQHGMNFDLTQKLKTTKKTNFTLFRERLESWKSNYGKIATSNQISSRLRENIKLEIDNLSKKRHTPKLYKRRYNLLEEYLPIRSNDQFKDWWHSSSSSNVYLFGFEGKVSKFSKKGRVIVPVFKHEDIAHRDVTIVEVDEEKNFVLFFNDDTQSLFLYQLTTGNQLLSIKTVIGHITSTERDLIFMLHVLEDFFILSTFKISTGENKSKIKVKGLTKNEDLQELLDNDADFTSTIVDACISLEDDFFISIIQGVVYVYEIEDSGCLKKFSEFNLPNECRTGVDKENKKWISPIARCSVYNSMLLFRIGKKDVESINKSTWLNPTIFGIDLKKGEILWKIEELNEEVFSLHWCICTRLGLIVVTDKNFITCYDIQTNKLKWHRDDSDYESVLKSEDEDFGIPGLYMSSIGFEICGDTLIAYYIREKENSGVVYDMNNGETLHYLSISSNEKRVTNEGKMVSCKSLNFEREQHCNIL